MEADDAKTTEQTTVRIYKPTKERVQAVVRKMTGQGPRRVSEIEVSEKIFQRGLPELEQELGIKPEQQ